MAGPTPHVNSVPDGEKKNDARTSLMPDAASAPSASGGWLTKGTINLVIRFQSWFIAKGITG